MEIFSFKIGSVRITLLAIDFDATDKEVSVGIKISWAA